MTIPCLIAAFGCRGPQPQPTERHVAPLPSTPMPLASTPPASTEPDASSPPRAPTIPEDIKPACRGAALSFDTEDSENECRIPMNGDDVPNSPGPNDLEIAASVVEKAIAPGGTATVIVDMTNKTKEPMLLYVDLTCDDEPAFPISVFDANKKRVDFVSHANCDTKTFGCTRRVIRIVLEAGGSLRKKRAFTAKVTKVVADCGDVTAGSIRPGSYVLRVVTGFRADRNASTGYRPRRTLETTLVVK